MRSSNEAWDHLGELSEDDAIHVLTRLFALYEEQEQRNPDDPAAPLFLET